jgi:hypothetical protein
MESVMEHTLSTALGRRCGSAAYLSDAGTTSAAGPAGSSSRES